MRSMEKKDDVEDDDRNHLRIITAGSVPSDLTSTSLFADETDVINATATSLGFMDTLDVPSFHDYIFNYASSEGSASLFDLLQQPAPAAVATSFRPPEERWQLETSPLSMAAEAESSEVVNVPTTPCSLSVSCSSMEGGNDEKTEEDDQSQDHQDSKIKNPQVKSKKKNQKLQREPRFAFMTKSEVDHLDDGYRWRKYGQKAVKNSPFPRSYYRCTSGGCGVKKRVERSYDDESVVVTTYEGQHNHVSPTTPRGVLGFPPNAAAPIQSSFLRRVNYPFSFRSTLSSSPPTITPPHNSLTKFISAPGSLTSPLLISSLHEDGKRFGLAQPPSSSTDDTTTASASLTVRDRGLLQDIILPSQTMRDPKQE